MIKEMSIVQKVQKVKKLSISKKIDSREGSSPSKKGLQMINHRISRKTIPSMKLPYPRLGTEYIRGIAEYCFNHKIPHIQKTVPNKRHFKAKYQYLGIDHSFYLFRPTMSCSPGNCGPTLHANIYEMLLIGHDLGGAPDLVLNQLLPAYVLPGRQQIEHVPGSQQVSARLGNYLRLYPKSFAQKRLFDFQGGKKPEKSKQIQIYLYMMQ